MDLSNRIVEIRNRLNLSQEKFGELVGKSQRTVAAWEAGTRTPSFATLCALADVLNVSTDYLLGRTEIPNIYLDTKKDPSPEDRERAVVVGKAAIDAGSAPVGVIDDEEIPLLLRKLVHTLVRQELERQAPPGGDQ